MLLADASTEIGTGHVVRSLALASELRQQGVESVIAGKNVLSIARDVQSFRGVIRVELAEAFLSLERLSLVDQIAPDLVIIDGYEYPSALFEGLEHRNVKYGLIDDYGKTSALDPIFIVNQNPLAASNLYSSRFPNARTFLGLDYCLIRGEVKDARRRLAEKQHVLVSLGGSDPLNLSLTVSRVLSQLNMHTRIAIGPLVSDRERVLAELMRLRGVELIHQREFVDALSTARLAVLAAGSTLWEAAYLDKRTIAIIVAENQAAIQVDSRYSSPRLRYLDGRDTEGFDLLLEELVINMCSSHRSSSSDLKERIRPEKISSRLEELTEYILEESTGLN